MATIFLIILATFLVSLLSLVGVFSLAFKGEILNKAVVFLVDLSIGILLGVAFLDLLPEAFGEGTNPLNIFLFVAAGFFIFFLIENFLHWRHCHEEDCPIHTFAYTNILGDAVHNFTDGLIIAASFTASYELGIATTLAVVFHEIPHEIGDFGVLLYAGFSKQKAILVNFLEAVTAVAGGIIGFFLSESITDFVSFLLPFAAGGFIYIAATDLIPETRKKENLGRQMISFLIAVAGFVAVYALIRFVAE